MAKILIIKNNLSPLLVKRHLKRLADEEEAKRIERAKQFNHSTTSPMYSNTPVTTYIYFYEWSRMDGGMKTFTEYRAFFKFCLESGIILTPPDRQRLYDSNYNYVTCKKGKNELLISTTYCGLKDLLEHSDETKKAALVLAGPIRMQPPVPFS